MPFRFEKTYLSFVYPESMDSSRLKIRYAEDGGIDKDGVIEIRRGVEDLSLGESHYAQVRILVDGNRYLKGMAVYSDDLPDGVDVVFNTNKKQGTPTGDVLKKITNDPENPFGSLIKEHGGQNYNNRTIEPIVSAIVDEMKRKFLTKTARSQSQSIMFFTDPFRLVPVDNIAEIADKFTRNEIMTSNEFRQIIGMKPSDDPRADELRNKNLSEPGGEKTEQIKSQEENQNGEI